MTEVEMPMTLNAIKPQIVAEAVPVYAQVINSNL